MKYNFLTIAISLVLTAGFASCKNDKKNESQEEELARLSYSMENNQVTAAPLVRRTFYKQLVCNGRLEAVQRSNINFQTQGIVASIKVKEGDEVKRNQALAELDKESLNSAMQSAQLSYDKAVLNLADRLLDYGYSLEDTASIPAATKRIIYINTGYADAQLAFRNAQRNLQNAVLRAPFAGKIVGVQAKKYENTNGVFCTLIDDSYMTVRFNVLETEYNFVSVGQSVKVTPFNDNSIVILGNIESINPSVDDHGQIAVTAKVKNNGALLDGMNVKIVVENSVPDQLVVPKSAVVIRDNLEVVFRYVDGKSIWTYVKVLLSNTTEHSIVANTERGAELHEGDMIITSGNLNLGSGEVPVKLVK